MFHVPAHKQVAPAAAPAQIDCNCPGCDFTVQDQGSIAILVARTPAAKAWVEKNFNWTDVHTSAAGVRVPLARSFVDMNVSDIRRAGLSVGVS